MVQYIIDVQGFIYNRKFILREICVSSTNLDTVYYALVSVPDYFKENKESRWVKDNLHALMYDIPCGCEIYYVRRAVRNLNCQGGTFFCKGKSQIIKDLFNIDNIVDLQTVNCPSLKNLYMFQGGLCKYHSDTSPPAEQGCAFRNVQRLVCWYNNKNIKV